MNKKKQSIENKITNVNIKTLLKKVKEDVANKNILTSEKKNFFGRITIVIHRGKVVQVDEMETTRFQSFSDI